VLPNGGIIQPVNGLHARVTENPFNLAKKEWKQHEHCGRMVDRVEALLAGPPAFSFVRTRIARVDLYLSGTPKPTSSGRIMPFKIGGRSADEGWCAPGYRASTFPMPQYW
jgi:hypothetical protein